MRDLESLIEMIRPVLEEKRALKAILFGSFARGTEDRTSDIDLIIIDDEDIPYLRRLDKYYDDLVTLLRGPVDLFVYREEEFESMKDGPFVGRALKEGRVIYECGEVS